MSDFIFVTHNGYKTTEDTNLRKLMRRRVMQDAAKARKQSGSYGKNNLGQHPVMATQITQQTTSQSSGPLHKRQYHEPQPKKLSKKGGQLVRRPCPPISYPLPSTCSTLQISQDLSILNLAPATGLRLGIATLSFFVNDANQAAQTLSTAVPRSQKFLLFIPQRYGHIPSLSNAADCVIAKIRQIIGMGGRNGKYDVLRCHLRALRSIQRSLNDKNEWMNSETLCAVQLLGILELINNNPTLWLCHTAGASKLIETRGSDSFQSEFDLALFTAQIGPTVTEAILQNKDCFLVDPAWQKVMRSAILSDAYFSSHSQLIICLWTHLAWCPNHFRAVTDLIFSKVSPPEKAIATLLNEMWNHHQGLLSLSSRLQVWLDEWNFRAWRDRQAIILLTSNEKPAHIDLLEIQGTLILCRLLNSRLMYALAPKQYYALEVESKRLADQAMTLGGILSKSQDARLMGGLFISQTTWIAKATMVTHDMWINGNIQAPEVINTEGHDMIAKWKFGAWCRAMGRRVPVSG